MECKVCQRDSYQVCCASCIQEHIDETRRSLKPQDLSRAITNANKQCNAGVVYQSHMIDQLEELVANAEKEIASKRSKRYQRIQTIEKRRNELIQRKESLHLAWHHLHHLETRLNNKARNSVITSLNHTKNDIELSIVEERRRLVHQLATLFPIESTADGETIANLPFPSDITKIKLMNQEERASVISLIARILIITSKYLSIQLPYTISFKGSKAYIGREMDRIVEIAESNESLELGLRMIRHNVEALCIYQGIPSDFVKQWTLLHCIWQLFHSPSLGHNVHASLVAGEARVARVPAGRHLRPASSSVVENGEWDTDVNPMDSDSEFSTPADQWDFMERPQPPKPSNNDDIQHWVSSGAGVH